MCCYGKLKLTQDFLKKNRRRKTIEVYKLVQKYDVRTYSYTFVRTRLNGIYRSSFEYKPGIIKSRTEKKIITKDEEIKNGIHVWLSFSSAKGHQRQTACGYKIIKLTADVSDLIGVGLFDSERRKDNAVFKKVYLSQREYDKALGKKVKK